MDQTPSMIFSVLAALLRDIGKFARRAGAPASPMSSPVDSPHFPYTDYFINNDLLLPEELKPQRSYLAQLATASDEDKTEIAECLRWANGLAAGGTSLDKAIGDDEAQARLVSIFSTVRLGLEPPNHELAKQRYRLRPLNDSQAMFPVKEGDDTSYEGLYAQFKASLESLPQDMGENHYLSSLTSLLECYTWCVPRTVSGELGDISLHDHSWTTAAITQALLAQGECELDSKKLLLFGGDLSGIQNFIFGTEDTSSKNVNKLLRARSFLLQALVRSIWLVLLDGLDLKMVAKIMDAGGRFVLLLPDTEEVRQQVDKLEHEVEDYMLREFQGVLRMTFASLAIKAQDLEQKHFCECFENFNDELEKAKLKPFQRVLQKPISPVLEVDCYADYAEYGECPACHMRPATGKDSDGDGIPCKQCLALIDVGKHLPKVGYMVIDREPNRDFTSDTLCSLSLFGELYAHLEQYKPSSADREAVDIVNFKDSKIFSAAPLAGYIPVVEQDDLDNWQKENEGKAQSAGEVVELGNPKTLTMLAQDSHISSGDTWRSLPALAALKADVDNLGLLFSIGFGVGKESTFSLSHYAMLSRMLNHFFASHLIDVIEKEFTNIYVVFAGGDDLFVLGPWADIINFSQRLNDDFKKFAGGNLYVSLSAGLPLFKPRLPMRGIRHMADEAEKAAKDFKDKNAVSLFGITSHWDDFAELLDQGKWLEKLCLDEKITQGLVRRLLGYARDCEKFNNNGDISKGLYLSHLSYDLARNIDMDKTDLVDIERLQGLGRDKDFSNSVVSSTWALYRTRTSAKEDVDESA